jgi:FkbM family methyltransferase
MNSSSRENESTLPPSAPGTEKRLKSALASAAIPLLRALVRYGGNKAARRFLWNLAAKRLTWRSHPFEARTQAGFHFAGNSEELISRYIYYFGIWEPAITRWMSLLPLSGRTVVDVGAHFGWYSLLAARCVGPEGRVVSIEASPANLVNLRRNIALNQCYTIRCVHAAVWNKREDLSFFQGPASNAGASTVMAEFVNLKTQDGGDRYEAATRVKAVPLAELLAPEEIATAGLVKIDVEGAEWEAVKGMLPLLGRFPEDIRFLIELTPGTSAARYGGVHELVRVFTSQGFTPYIVPNEYNAEFYFKDFDSISCGLTELHGDITHQIDLVFARQ